MIHSNVAILRTEYIPFYELSPDDSSPNILSISVFRNCSAKVASPDTDASISPSSVVIRNPVTSSGTTRKFARFFARPRAASISVFAVSSSVAGGLDGDG